MSIPRSARIYVAGHNGLVGSGLIRALARRGAAIVMACRDAAKAEAARDEIAAEVPGAELEIRELDLASLDSVRKFAEGANADLDRIDVLINNAGLFPPKLRKTAEGFEAQFGVNYLGHFLLTHLLLDKLKASAPSRVVHLTSMLHAKGDLDFDTAFVQVLC